MQWLDWGGFEHPSELVYSFVLCNLQSLGQAFPLFASVPYLKPICEDRNDKHIVYLAPVKEVKAADGVAKNVNALYDGLGMVCHCVDIEFPVEAVGDENPKIVEQ